MNFKTTAVAFSVLVAIPALATAQTNATPPKPTKASAQKVVQEISADKAKLDAYCALVKLDEQMAEADQKHDDKKLESLGEQADALAQKIGADYVQLMDGLGQLSENAADTKDIVSVFEPLDKQCK